ncbi:MAG TPA: hypothetical protein P5311_01555, partial [Candidatus Dojkabacteria bacterium]|nr:hypothetical protein [Candidatus Dojkabacteria bacterium]
MESPDMKSPGGEQTSQPSVAETRAQYVQEVMKGQDPKDRAYLKDEKGQFASPSNENATLYVRDQHIEAARQEMNADFAQREANAIKHQETVVQAESPNIRTDAQVGTGTPLRTAVEIAMAGKGQIEQKYKTQEQPVERDLH